MNTESLIAKINACSSHAELDGFKDEAWDHPDFDVWSAYVEHSIELNRRRNAAVVRNQEAEILRRMSIESGCAAMELHNRAAELAQRLHMEAADRFQRQCDLVAQQHHQMFNGGF